MGSRRLDPGRTSESVFRRVRRVLAVCLAASLLGAALAPHHHKNDLADLLTGGRSDSGVFLDVSPIVPGDAPAAESLRWIDDDPCFACLPFDFVAAPPATPPRKTELPASARRSAFPADAERSRTHPLLGSRSPPTL